MCAPGRRSRGIRAILYLFLLALCTTNAAAQSIVDARRVEFLPSADNSVVDSNGVAKVDHYTLDIYQAGGTTVVNSANLGKPVPDPDGFVRVDFVSLLSQPLTAGVSYEAVVSAVGPGGTTASPRSNTFGYSEPCSFSLSPQSQSFAAAGGTGSFAVTTGSTCQWTAASQAGWVTVTAGAATTGPGSVSFSVASSAETSPRTTTILAGGWNFTVQQAAAPAPSCTYAVSPASVAVASAATSTSVTVTAAAGCAWTSSSPVSWVTISSGGAGSGNGTVVLSISRNGNRSSRSATLKIAGQDVIVTQKGRLRR